MLDYLMAAGALLGAVDRAVLRNRLGLGERFEEGFLCLGAIALNMAGIMCIAPALAGWMSPIAAFLLTPLHMDPAMIGALFANNMGGWPLAEGLAVDPEMGRFFGLVVSSMLGASLVYTIPIGLGLIGEKAVPYFLRGMLIGLLTMPMGAFVGGCLMGIAPAKLVWNMLPSLLLVAVLLVIFRSWPEKLIGWFGHAAKGIQFVAVIGLGAAAFSELSGMTLIPGMDSLSEAMRIVAEMGIVQLGCLPLAELFIRLLKNPLARLGKLLRIDPIAAAGLPIACVNVVSVFVMVKDMDRRGTVLFSAWAASSIAVLTAHFSYTRAIDSAMVTPVIAAKLISAVTALFLAYFMEKGETVSANFKDLK